MFQKWILKIKLLLAQTGSQLLLFQLSTIRTLGRTSKPVPSKELYHLFSRTNENASLNVYGVSELIIERKIKKAKKLRIGIASEYFQKYVQPGSISSNFYPWVAQHPFTTIL